MINLSLLKQRREEMRISMRGMASEMGYASPSAYFRIEHGIANVTEQQLRLLSEVLELSWNDLLGISPAEEMAIMSENDDANESIQRVAL